MAAAVDESALPSISTFTNLLPLEERSADMHVSSGRWGRSAEGGDVGVGGAGSGARSLRRRRALLALCRSGSEPSGGLGEPPPREGGTSGGSCAPLSRS